ncbi:Hypothetical protein IALB_1239 [Ignavibacterium album JCM 16511]|uniref:Uncharacterized protein n=1 Tax=Ignavibacterium album (strain DSM 19864 / JCM 16511 / NBRC 101810 / Mat9-16) TaxID=945713 RepID=I0AIZ3_IGNAJ|nr:hypothetical protein [Ignavibacterium album]AFH48950.1 Hypothetical protein IALB_1239 [Ignavibacterium album JCM 16511]
MQLFYFKIQQGSILFIYRENISPEYKPILKRIIRQGEQLIDNHYLQTGEIKFYDVITRENERDTELLLGYVEVNDFAIIEHREHNPLYLTKGYYEIRKQRTYNPIEERRYRYEPIYGS